MCAKHVAERPRRRVRPRALVTAVALVAAFGFLTWLADLDSGAEARGRAQARASVALGSWHPGEDHAPVLQEMRALADSGIADADTLRTLAAQWDHTASATDTEALSRASIFVAALSSSVVALALVAQATDFGSGFVAFGLVLLPVVYFLGVVTIARLSQVNAEDARWVQGMNRIRNAYLQLAPELLLRHQ